jgi:hypothetical protein
LAVHRLDGVGAAREVHVVRHLFFEGVADRYRWNLHVARFRFPATRRQPGAQHNGQDKKQGTDRPRRTGRPAVAADRIGHPINGLDLRHGIVSWLKTRYEADG